MVARAPRRSTRSGRHALRRLRAAGKSRPHHRRRRTGNQLQAGRNAALQRPRHRRLSRARSKTPSRCSAPPRRRLRRYHNARAGKYKLLELTSRVENRPLAEVRIVDLREDFRRAAQRCARFANPCAPPSRCASRKKRKRWCSSIAAAIPGPRSAAVAARSCNARIAASRSPITKAASASNVTTAAIRLRPPKQCPKCHAEYMYFVGDGAERVEEYLREQFPKARIARLDRDTVRTKREFQQVLGAFAKGEIDVLVGTQMVAKGHDFRARHAGRSRRRRSRARPPRFSRRRTHFPTAHAGRRPRRPRRAFR